MASESQIINRLSQASRPFHGELTEEYILCIRAGARSLCMAVYDEEKERFITAGDYVEVFAIAQGASPVADSYFPQFFREVAHESPFLVRPFKKVRIAWEGDRCTLIPSSLFVPDEMETYLSFQTDTGHDSRIQSSRLQKPDAVEVFTIPLQVRETLARAFGNMELCHVAAPLIYGILSDHSEEGENRAMFLNLRERWFDLVILEGNRLLYHNIFPWQEPADVAYYLLYVMEQFHLGLESTPLHLLGKITPGDELYRLILRYVTRASFPAPAEGSPFSTLPENMAYHAYFTLLNLARCGS